METSAETCRDQRLRAAKGENGQNMRRSRNCERDALLKGKRAGLMGI